MRQGQQNRRGRGRGRKVQNPLSRNYESNGPDVKIRGNAAHIAEKYSALSRDAQAAGDTIMAENFLQHAEHYNRIIMAAQAQSSAQQAEGANGSGNHRGQNDQNDQNDDGDDDTNDNEQEPEVRAEAPKTNGRSRRGGGNKDNAPPQGESQQSDTQQSDAQQGEDMAQESDNAAA